MKNSLDKFSNFCPVPWKQFASTTDGYQRTCCTMSLQKKELLGLGVPENVLDNCKDLEDGYYIFDKGEKLKVIDGINRYISSDSTRNIKSMFSRNMTPYQCRCYFTEKINPEDSRRINYLRYYNIHNDNDVENFLKIQNHDIDYYDIRLGNVCNLQCLMCSGIFSNQLYEESIYRDGGNSTSIEGILEIKKINNTLVYDKELEKKIFNWADEDFFNNLEKTVVEDLTKNKNKIITFYMIGGEPLLNDPHFKFLNKMVELGLSKNIKLEYNTNLIALTDEIINLWKHFHKMVLAISIDDIEDRYEYIRYPGKWSKIQSNLDLISRAIKDYPTVFSTVNVVAVVNLLTAYKFSNLVNLIQSYGINVSKIMSTGPVYTTPAILTAEEKNQYIDLIKHDQHYNELLTYVNSFRYQDHMRKEFLHMLKFWESKRRRPFNDVFPDLAKILNLVNK